VVVLAGQVGKVPAYYLLADCLLGGWLMTGVRLRALGQGADFVTGFSPGYVFCRFLRA
jgi:hypothetical protein